MKNKIQRRTLTKFALTGLAMAAAGLRAHATEKPLRLVLPVSAGSGVDTIMRAAVPSLTKALDGQAVVIDNLPGAGGITGTSVVVRAPADGLTLGIVSNNHVVNPSVFKKMPFDVLNDVTPICVIGATPFVLVVNAKVPAQNVRELQALLKAKPGEYNYGSSGNGTILHLGGAMFADAAGVDVHHIPYKGVGPMVADLIGGQIQMAVTSVPSVQGQLKSGALRAIGVMGKARVPSLPEIPTVAEQGLPSVDIAGWFALIGPAKLPGAQVERLHAAIVTAFNTPETRDAMLKQENIINPMSPEASAQFFRTEQERYAQLVKTAKISVE
ncbi:Bug family tripartite tricarboxylate transporter substrate binding protein [Variovorax ginsengisoli]|uniref:Tripartite-type tricarboxylate transporter receptor subunit TctC n=1 Tax=Variovorax ginsengisoli TaxID=363844 RepID=A0ABT9SEL7_9BURK|nr:tripartite tricarboxylate transporter substrate binding protein [Variovorax ginsengisoli]MDP9902804.1 tripartite-type tricarboxylate transporter receptor subunit TctC [Variovorax ginsengisoli]